MAVTASATRAGLSTSLVIFNAADERVLEESNLTILMATNMMWIKWAYTLFCNKDMHVISSKLYVLWNLLLVISRVNSTFNKWNLY